MGGCLQALTPGSRGTQNEGPGVDPVAKSDPAWEEIAQLLRARGSGFERRYGFEMHLRKLWRVRPSEALRQREAKARKLGKPTKLFHGTSMDNALAIAESGFRLPRRPGMFGRGVYFANVPMKSANYAPEKTWGPFLKRVQRVMRDENASFWDLSKRDEGQLLLCDVYLGRTMTKRRSCPNIDPSKDLKAGWFGQLCGYGDYTSVHAPGGLFGAVHVDELVVYAEHQGVPQYLIEFDYKHLS